MKLASVILSKPIHLPGMRESSHEVSAEECEGLRYDEKLEMVIMGDHLVPSSQVIRLERANDGTVCPECGDDFNNAQALGGHMGKKHPKPNADRR